MIHKNDLKQIIKEEYHKVKNYMESEYGFTPELGKVMSNPYVNAFSSVNEESYKVAGRPVTLIKGKKANGTDWKVRFQNGKETALSDVLSLIKPFPKLVKESTPDQVIKDLDKAKNDLLKKVDALIAKKKKLYSDVDIEAPMSSDEKKLDKDIADLFSQINKLVLQKRSVKKESVSESSIEEAIPVGFEIGDFIHFKKANKTGMVKKINGDKITIMTMKGDFIGDIKDVQVLYQDNVNEGGESDADMAVDQLQSSIEHAQELLDKLRSRSNLEPWVQSLITKAEDYLNIVNNNDGGEESIEEYDVENYEDIKEFTKFMENYKPSLNEAEYQGRKVKLGKIMQGDVKKFKVYVKNDKDNVVKVNFGQGGDAKGGTMRIRKDNPEARKSFRARHNCDNPGPRWKARYWSCKKW